MRKFLGGEGKPVATKVATALKSAIHIAVRQKKFANTTKVEYEFPEKSVIFRAGRVLDNFLLVIQRLFS